MGKTRRIFCIVAAFLSLVFFVNCFQISVSAATKEAQIQAAVDKYYSAVSKVGIPHWNANHSMGTLMKNADSGNYAADVTPYECPYPNGHSPTGGTCDSNHFSGEQCFGFAKYMCYVVFGNYPTKANGQSIFAGTDKNWNYIRGGSFPTLQAGDMLRYWYYVHDTKTGTTKLKAHAYFIYSNNNGKIKVIDCNQSEIAGGKCIIQLRQLSDSKLESIKDYWSKGTAYVCRNKTVGTIDTNDPPTNVSVVTDTVTELTDTGARLNGHFTASKNVHITEHGAYMGTDPNNMVKVAVDKVNYNKSKLTMFYRTGKYYGDLTPGTTYYYRQYVVADDKEFKGDIVSFTTYGRTGPEDPPTQPPVSPPAAPSITVRSDTIYVGQSATIRWNSVADTLVYSLIISGTKVGSDQFDGSNTSYVLSNLPEGTYTIRLYASGSGGTSPESNTVTLKVIPKPSVHHVYTTPATNITATSAQLNGSFSSDTKPHMTEHGAYMGTDPNAMTKVAVDKVNYYKSSLTMFYSTSKYNISLTPGTTYYFYEYAIVDGIEIRGDIRSFTTLPKQAFNNGRVYTAPATNITATSAQLNGSFSSDAKPHMTEHGAYMGTDPNAMTKVAVDKVNYYKSSLTMFYSTSKYYGSLSPDTTYYFCEYAVLDGVEVRGETLSFTTSKQQSSSIRNGVIRGTVGNLSIRSGPGTSYTKLGRIPEGATCTVDLSRTSGSWYWVTYNGISGYASKNYIVLR